jgi:hypothetical protein
MKYISLVFLVLCTMIVRGQQDTARVLFLGNSYTAYNNLPNLFAQFSAAGGHNSEVESNTPGGYRLQGHSTNTQSLQLINEGNWDYVVLQEQSQIPSLQIGQVNSLCFPYAEDLNEAILAANPCTETVFYMTWGRKNGDAGNCSNWPPVCTYQGMDSLLSLRYMQMTNDNDAIVSPVGAVWRFLRENFSSIELYANDESHPSAAGSYAAACAFYSVIHRADPELVAFDGPLNALHALQIRYAVKTVVFDSLSKWNVGSYDTTTSASFTIAQSGLNASFNNTSINAQHHLWFFGDGDTSTTQHPSHHYPGPGTYGVELVSIHCDSSDTAFGAVIIDSNQIDTSDTTTGIVYTENQVRVYPIPASNSLWIEGLAAAPYDKWVVQDLTGRILKSGTLSNNDPFEVRLDDLESGQYFIKLSSDDTRKVYPIILR